MVPPELLKQLDRILQRAMALKPEKRYQYVADFANDLKGVMRALPPPVPPTPPPGTAPRQPDVNSTQPDLPMLYETLQAAKDSNNQGGPGTQNAFPSSMPGQSMPISSPAGNYCPRCNAPINPQAVFCPRCGAALGGVNVQSRASNPGIINAASEDATMIVTPPGKFAQAAMGDANRAPAASNPASLSGTSAYSSGQQMAQAPLFSNNATLNGTTPQKGSLNGSASSQPDVDIRLFIALIVVVVVLVAIAIVLLIR